MGYFLFFVINVLLAAWVAEDAKQRAKSGAWGILVFFTGVVGLAVYFAAREGFQREDQQVPVTIKLLAGMFVVSVLINVFLFSQVNTTTSQGANITGQLIENQGSILRDMAFAMRDVLQNPSDEEALSRLITLNEASIDLLSIQGKESFVEKTLLEEVFLLASNADQVIDRYYHGDRITDLTEQEYDNLWSFTTNIIRASSDMNSISSMYARMNLQFFTTYSPVKSESEVIEALEKFNQFNKELGLL